MKKNEIKYINRWIICAVFLFACSGVSAQITFQGTIRSNEKGEIFPLTFATVTLCNLADTLKSRTGTLTDTHGDFIFRNLSPAKYVVSISFLGYGELRDTVVIRINNMGGNVVRKDYLMDISSQALDSVVVTANPTTMGIDRTEYLITSQDTKTAVSALELVEKVPQLRLNRVDQKITSLQGSVKILINGANATEKELRALRKEDVKSIEYFSIPPVRFGEYGCVVNFKTRNLEVGFYGAINAQETFTTGFGNEDISLKYNNNKSQISFIYALNHRNYRNISSVDTNEYVIDDIGYFKDEERKSTLKYHTHYFNIGYQNNSENDHLFQVSLIPVMEKNKSGAYSAIKSRVANLYSERKGERDNSHKYMGLSADIYYCKKLKGRKELLFNIVGTYYDLHRRHNYSEYYTNNLLISDNFYQDNYKGSFIAEGMYTSPSKLGDLTIGNTFRFEHLSTDFETPVSSATDLYAVFNNLTYAALSKSYAKWMYRVSLGGRYINNRNTIARNDSFTFVPSLVVGYKHSNDLMFTGNIAAYSSVPTLGQLSNITTYVMDGILSKGNPELKNPREYNVILTGNYNKKRISGQLNMIYVRYKNRISAYYTTDGRNIISTYQNIPSTDVFGLLYAVNFPFRINTLDVSFNMGGMVSRETYKNEQYGTYSSWRCPQMIGIELKWKKFQMYYMWGSRSNQLNGINIDSKHWESNAGMKFVDNNFSCSVDILNLGTRPVVVSETIPDIIVDRRSRSVIMDNYNMVTFTVGYRLHTGKPYVEKRKVLKNKDTDLGL